MRYVDPADDLKAIGTPECDVFRRKVFKIHRPISRALSADYYRVFEKRGYVEANRRLSDLDNKMFLGDKFNRINATAPDSEVKEWCKARAHECDCIFAEALRTINEHQAFKEVTEHIELQGLEFPLVLKPCMTEDEKTAANIAAVARCIDPKWWRKQVRTILARKLETVARDVRIVSASDQLYCSDFRVASRKRQKARNDEILESLEAENQDGQVFTLKELADKSLANPRNRFAEMITRAKGFDEVAKTLGHEGWMFTLTTPSRFHRMNKGGSKDKPKCYANTNWGKPTEGHEENATPRDGQDYLCKVWAKVRAKFKRKGILFYGTRVCEPHHDGTPHWHLALFFKPEDMEQAEAIFREYALEDTPNEKGAKEQRFDSFKIDFEHGGATGYLVKYLTKNLAGCGGMEKELDLESADQKELFIDETQGRVEAWASCWGIRQFQFVGSPSVTVWRELRGVDGDDIQQFENWIPEGEQLTEAEQQQFLEMKLAADAANWAAFVMLMGGAGIPKKDYKLQAWRVPKREINDYYEFAEKIAGVVLKGAEKVKEVMTRFTVWTIRPAKREEDREAGTADPWTCVNNCTEPTGGGNWAYG